MAHKLLLLKLQAPVTSPLSRYGTAYGKPSFPSDVCQSTKLCDQISQDFWSFFQTLQIDTAFLREKAATWPNNDSYQQGLENIDDINVVNDCAERVVKPSTDFPSCARSENHFQNILQVVQNDRSKTTNIRKSSQC